MQTAPGNNNLDFCQKKETQQVRLSTRAGSWAARLDKTISSPAQPLLYSESKTFLLLLCQGSPDTPPACFAQVCLTSIGRSGFKLGEHFFATDSADQTLLPTTSQGRRNLCGADRPSFPTLHPNTFTEQQALSSCCLPDTQTLEPRATS